jgi:two-component system sensor histidine kinase RstB
MTKLFIKTTLALLIMLSIILTCAYLVVGHFFYKDMDATNKELSKGVFTEIQYELSQAPQSHWKSILNKLQDQNTAPANIVEINNLKLSTDQKANLMAGKKVSYYGTNFQFFDYGIANGFIYQRIGNTPYALHIMIGITVQHMISELTGWMAHLLILKFHNTPQNKWNTLLKPLENQYGLHLSIQSTNNLKLPSDTKQRLAKFKITYKSSTKNLYFIKTLYLQLPNSNKILVIGPIHYSWAHKNFKTINGILTVALSAILVILLTWLFSRNINKIYKMTEQYGDGNFNYKPKFNRFSTLRNLYNNVLSMGENLNRLLQSHYNMTRFVAHEARTPLTTMQLAFEKLENDQNISQESKTHITTIKHEMSDLNKLISEFLLYSQSANHELTLNKKEINIVSWLTQLISRYKAAKVDIHLTMPNHETSILVDIDPTLLKHAIDNLLTNALKFAQHKIEVTLSHEKNNLLIFVDDDGQQIAQEDHSDVFEAFTRLESDSTFGEHIGLGLNIAKSIIDLHGGTITISDSPLGGAQFSVKLPA